MRDYMEPGARERKVVTGKAATVDLRSKKKRPRSYKASTGRHRLM
jgi:hypothetical protein